MSLDIRKQWVNALRSNEYEQGGGRLKNGRKFCCLGVLCDLAVKAGRGRWSDDDTFIDTNGDLNSLGLTTNMANWVGCGQPDALVRLRGQTYSLADLNDTGTSFNEIADLIEKDLL